MTPPTGLFFRKWCAAALHANKYQHRPESRIILIITPLRLTSRTSQAGSSSSSPSKSSLSAIPAFAQTISTLPWSFRVSRKRLTISDQTLTLHFWNVAPFGSDWLGLTSAATTFAPCELKYSTVPFPIPLEPPYINYPFEEKRYLWQSRLCLWDCLKLYYRTWIQSFSRRIFLRIQWADIVFNSGVEVSVTCRC